MLMLVASIIIRVLIVDSITRTITIVAMTVGMVSNIADDHCWHWY